MQRCKLITAGDGGRVISIQELRKHERQRQLEQLQTAHKPGKFPWQKGVMGQPVPESEPQGALKLARLLYG